MNTLQKLSVGARRGDGLGLLVLLLVVVLGPSVCLLWFMTQAVRNERLAVRQKLVEAYRGHLALAQERLEAYWQRTADALDAEAERLAAPLLFAKHVRDGLADAVICLDASGKITYPTAAWPPEAEPPDPRWDEAQRLETTDPRAAAAAFGHLADQATNANFAARALQAQARSLLQAGQQEAAITVLTEGLARPRYQDATDGQGRLLVPNAQLLALELLHDAASERARTPLVRLKERLLDYGDTAMSAAQRRFLMRELQRRFPGQVVFPTLAAEDLAARYVEAGQFHLTGPVLRESPLPGIWEFGSGRGRVVTLHQTDKLLARMQAAVSTQVLSPEVTVAFFPPGAEAAGLLSTPAGSALPGWRLGLAFDERRLFESAAEERIATYIWIGVLVVAAVAVLGLVAWRLVRRQMTLTRLRNDLVANVTHELKTPLSSMRLLVDTLLDSPRLNEQTAREYLELIARENTRLSRLIDNFLAFSRMERNKYALDFKDVPAAAIVEGAVAAVRERFNVPGCRFDVRLGAGLPAVRADADALVTALVNLLDNAYKYSGDDKQIALSAEVENGTVVFTVTDNGIGLAPRETKRIFKRFYQVDQRLSRTGGGCGLGLSIVKFIVTAHQGRVEVRSQPGRGSTFTVSIPAADSPPEVSRDRPREAQAAPAQDHGLAASASVTQAKQPEKPQPQRENKP